MNKNYIIARTATLKDKEHILDLLNEVFEKQQRTISKRRDESFWKWKYENNIFNKAIIHVIEINNEILASGTMWPFEFKYQNQILKGYQTCDLVVKEKARRKGLFTKINEARLEYAKNNKADFLFSFPNQNSLPGYLKMGWHFVGKIKWQVKILNPLQVIKNGFSLSQSIRLKVEDTYKLDMKVIEKALRYNNENNSIFMLNSSVEYYQWRHKAHPTRDYGMIKYQANNEISVAIFHIMQKNDLKEMVILEVLSSKKNYLGLMNHVIKEAKSMKIGYIAMIKQKNQKSNNLLYKGFLPKKNKNFVCYPYNNQIEANLLQYSNWNLIASLHDSI